MNFDSRRMGPPPKKGFFKKKKPLPPPTEVKFSQIYNIPMPEIKTVISYTISANNTPTEGFCAVIGDHTICYEDGKEVFRFDNKDFDSFEFECIWFPGAHRQRACDHPW